MEYNHTGDRIGERTIEGIYYKNTFFNEKYIYNLDLDSIYLTTDYNHSLQNLII